MINKDDVHKGKLGGLFTISSNFTRISVLETNCEICGKVIYVRSHRIKKNKHFCSTECRLKVYPMNGKNHPLWNKKRSDITLEKMKKAQLKEKGSNWKGGIINESGYILEYKGQNNYIQQHRLIAERVLGRRLKNNEVVHHINMNKKDNRKENLLVCDVSYHSFLHQQMQRAWVKLVGLGISHEIT